MRVYVLHLHTNIEVLRPYRSEDMTHLCVRVSRPVTLSFDLETGAQCSTYHGTLLPILVILRLFVFDLWAIGSTRLRLIT